MYLLDTCTLLWAIGNPTHLSTKTKNILEEAKEGTLFVSAMSTIEIGLKQSRNKFKLIESSLTEWFQESQEELKFQKLSIDFECGTLSTQLPPIHKDPYDRILIATAQIHHLTLLTPDSFIRQYPNLMVEW